jgi:MFS family permease
LATALNNDELVRLLLEHGAGHPPQSAYAPVYPSAGMLLDPEQRKKRITFWMLACIIISVISAFVGIINTLAEIGIRADSYNPRREAALAVLNVMYLFFFLIPATVAFLVSYYFFVLRLWEEVPREFARNTPSIMAGLSLIPIFSWYWMFIALPGLYNDMNKAIESYGRGTKFSTTLIVAICIFWLASDLVSIMLGSIQGIANVAAPHSGIDVLITLCLLGLSVLYCALTLPMYWIIRSKVVEFIDIKSSVGR